MRPETMRAGLHWLDNQFVLIRHEDDELPSVDWIIGLARAAVMRHGIRGLLRRPLQRVGPQAAAGADGDRVREPDADADQAVRAALRRARVVRGSSPAAADWRGEAPGALRHIRVGALLNKCDNGIVVHRNRDEKLGSLREVTIHVAKVRNKVAGAIGDPKLEYNLTNGGTRT